MADEPGFAFENAAFAGVQPFRDARAPAPGADADALREAYLGVLKLALCDLASTQPSTVYTDFDGIVKSRALPEDELYLRATGMDWPLRGLTMAGLNRLDDLQACVQRVVRDGVEGDLVEAGTWRGGSAILMRATLDALGATDRTVCVADSFAGFAPGDGRSTQLAEIDFLAIGLEEVRENFARFGLTEGVEFVRGYFEDSLHALRDRRWAIVRLDGDTYAATKTALEELYPSLAVGGHLIVDDYGAFEECQRAVDDFRAAHGISEPLEQVDWTCARWQRTSDTAIERPAREPRPTGGETPSAPREHRRIPTLEETDAQYVRSLRDLEIDQLRARVGEVEAEVEALKTSPLSGPRAWLRHRHETRARR